MIRRIGFCLFILLFSLRAAAIGVLVSHATFYMPDSAATGKLSPVVEVYWQINPRTLHYETTTEKKIIGYIKTDIVFTNEAGGSVGEDHFILETVPRNTAQELTSHSIIDLRRYNVGTGYVKIKATFTDINDSAHHYVYTDSFTIAPAQKSAFYSDLQLLDTIIASTDPTVFYKNARQQIPACGNFLDNNSSHIKYYTELYKTNEVPADDYPLIQKTFIAKREDQIYSNDFLRNDTIRSKDMKPIAGSMNISALPSGNYYLYTKLENHTHDIIASASLFFQRLNTNPPPPDTGKKSTAKSDTGIESINVLNLNKTFLAKYSLGEIRAILKMLLPVSDAAGVKAINTFLKKPDEMYMRYYIYNYFANINKKEPGKAWKEYASRIKEVNAKFTAHGVPGYETDRGFIYLRYGEPTEVITVENEQNAVPYEVWQYNTLTEKTHKDVANALFLFYKQSQMTSDYKILHSTVSGEVQNPSWRSYLYIGGQGGDQMNSRAQQYFGSR